MRPKGAKMKNKAHFVAASGVVSTPALFHATYLHVVSGLVEMFRNRETERVSRNGSKVFTSAFPELTPDFANV